ncbi:MAG: phage antirepressor protein [Deltaproteobacteria bacterium RIFOXYA12_FULL_61_11]|nr:MAG: phage antirepressor protein [Deltaproteobacteria bacterium RIFOXYA12_FULL_61_11]
MGLVVFKSKQIRRLFHEGAWWFSVIDVCAALIDSPDPGAYWRKLKQRLKEEGLEPVTFCHGLKMRAADGKQRETDCATTEGCFRIIQSIPSPKAEPFKRWLAKVGYERVQEIEDPELATARTKEIYRAKGYSEAWIEKHLRGIAVRAELTDEWQRRGIEEQPEYAILTAEISKAAFGLTPSEYKDLKGLERENLRDHMTDLELIFSMLGEAATTEIARKQDAQGFAENKVAARKGGTIAGEARTQLEKETGGRVVSPENYLAEPESRKRLKG